MRARLEHANVVVPDVDAVAQFLMTAFPSFAVRFEGVGTGGRRWLHVGDDETYLALSQAGAGAGREAYGPEPGLNHLGFVVDDVAGVHRRLLAAGYTDSTVPNDHPHRRRVYFLDPTGLDWEFVQYLSDAPAERNDYSDAR